MVRVGGLVVALLVMAGSAQAASNAIQYGDIPSWVAPPPARTAAAPPPGAAVQVIYTDNQVRVGPNGEEFFSAYRFKILTPEALPLGNISATWNPNTDDIRVHSLEIIRDGRVVNVLDTAKFAVIQRENNLEYAMLDGALTATLQAPGLQVGDELEFAATITRRDPTLGDRSQGAMVLPSQGAPGAYRMRLVWPKAATVHWRATPDMGELKPVAEGDQYVLSYELRDPPTAITADGAPPRVNLRRYLQFSGFSNWAEVSNLVWPLFEKASRLKPDSPIKAEAARIAAATSDPGERMAAALEVVQDQIRYVYVALGDGNYRPADADETWTRRFGDCKAKAALLLALLRELNVPAEAVLVNAQGGDGTDQQLPTLGAFNHVVVRATAAGEAYWLDGTRLGDHTLKLLPPPAFRWGLPLRTGPVDLEPVTPQPPLLPLDAMLLQVDTTAGFDAPAKVSAEEVVRGDEALSYRTSLAQVSKEDADRMLKAYWRDKLSWVEPAETAWRYDQDQHMTVLTLKGEGKPDWEGDEKEGRSLDIFSAGFYKPAEFRRPKEQDQNAPWLTTFPSYKRWTTVIRLPVAADGWKWGYRASTVDDQFGGVAYWRTAELRDGVMRTTMSRRTFRPEITAAEAQEANKKREDFDNLISQVFQSKPQTQKELSQAAAEAEARAGRDAEGLTRVGLATLDAQLDRQALQIFDKALAIKPDLDDAIIGKANALVRLGKGDAAVAFLEKVRGDGADPQLMLARAQFLIEAGRPTDAASVIEIVLAGAGDDAQVLAQGAYAAYAAGRHDLAMKAADKAAKLAPDDLFVRQVRGSIYAGEKRWADALPDVDAAIRLQPEEPANFRNRAQVLRHLRQFGDALADIDEVLRMDPLDIQAVDVKASILRAQGRTQEALALYDGPVKAGDPNSLNSRCWTRAIANVQLPLAEADCAEAVRLAPKVAGYWDSYGLVALRMNKLDEALRRYDHALALNPKMAASLYARGLTKLRQGDDSGGRADIAAAKAMAPNADAELTEAGVTP